MTKRIKKRAAPEVPEKQLLIRTSERSSFKTCLHQWQWGWIELWKPRQEAPALTFGGLIHEALEKRYPPGVRRGLHPAKTFEKLYDKQTKEAYKLGFRDEDGSWLDAGALGVDMLEHYVEHYGKDEEWEVIASEQTFQVPVFDPENEKYLFTYVGTIDGVWKNRMDGSIRINDYKTTAKDPLAAIRDPGYTGTLDQQASAYWTWGVDWLIEQGIIADREMESLDGFVYTYLRKAMRDERPQDESGQYLNKDGSISKKQPAPYFHRELVYRSRAEREITRARAIVEIKRMIELRAGPASERFKAPGWMTCKFCPFVDPCEIHEMGQDYQAILDGAYDKWEPYTPHEIELEGRR